MGGLTPRRCWASWPWWLAAAAPAAGCGARGFSVDSLSLSLSLFFKVSFPFSETEVSFFQKHLFIFMWLGLLSVAACRILC